MVFFFLARKWWFSITHHFLDTFKWPDFFVSFVAFWH